MDSLIDSLGLLCLAIQKGQDQVGRTKLQKMIYFADRYLGWDVGDYGLYYYGPYSQNLASTLKTARGELIKESKREFGPYEYTLTEQGGRFVQEFEDNVCDQAKTDRTRQLFGELSKWSKDELELAATLDYVSNNTPGIQGDDLLRQVSVIKENHPSESIKHAYELWSDWKTRHSFQVIG